MTEPERWVVTASLGRATAEAVEVVAAADFDRLREERDAYARQVERLDRMVQEMGESRGISELAEARRVAGVLADAHRRIADLPIVDDSDADRMREIAEDALAATPDPRNGCRAPHCFSEYGTPCGTCPALAASADKGWSPGIDDPEPPALGDIDTGEGWYQT